jgi:hypothetical protein
MNSRRLMGRPWAEDCSLSNEKRVVHDSKPDALMSALGHKRTSEGVGVMSALPPKADMVQHDRDVRFVPKADIHELCRMTPGLSDWLQGAIIE